MTLIVCPECTKEVSEHAKTCPNCGYPDPASGSSKQKEEKIDKAIQGFAESILGTPDEIRWKSQPLDWKQTRLARRGPFRYIASWVVILLGFLLPIAVAADVFSSLSIGYKIPEWKFFLYLFQGNDPATSGIIISGVLVGLFIVFLGFGIRWSLEKETIDKDIAEGIVASLITTTHTSGPITGNKDNTLSDKIVMVFLVLCSLLFLIGIVVAVVVEKIPLF